MDLSLKKRDLAISQELPQDLSVKKTSMSSAGATPMSLYHQALISSVDKTRIPPPVETSKIPSPVIEKTRNVVEPKTRIVPTLIEQKSRIIPDLDQYIRAMMNIKPSFADPHLRTLAHQKAKTFAGQSKKAVSDVRTPSLVIPKRSALVIPNPRNRTFSDQKPKAQTGGQSSLLPHKPFSPRTCKDTPQPKQVLDLRKKSHSPHTITERLLSSNLHHTDSLHTDGHAFLQALISPQSNGSYTTVFPVNDVLSRKRRRKQECPRKRVRMEYHPPEQPPDPVFTISDEFLDKVTDAAQNGELSKGLDEYFGQTAERLTELSKIEEGGEGNDISDFAQELQLNDCDDVITNDDSASPSSSRDNLSPFQSPSPPGQKQKQKQSRAALQNREERKTLRLYGKEYTTPSGKTYPQRQVRHKDCSRCRYNCSTTISADQRQAIFDHFWSLDSYVKRLYYYCQSIKEKPAKTMKHTRECSREYTFLVDGERVRVCKGFYLATLDVSDKAVRIAMEKRKRGKGLWDKRGAHPPHNKTRPEDKDRVRSHIESFVIRDIYSKTCESTPSGVPGQDLNVTKMHQDYAQGCKDDGKEPVSEDVYRKTFNTEFNLSTVQV